MMTTASKSRRLWRNILTVMIATAIVAMIADVSNRIKPDEDSAAIAGDFPMMPGADGPVYTAVISGYDKAGFFEGREVQYQIIDGLPITEGDIILNLRDDITLGGLGVAHDSYLWPDGLIPYEIDPALPMQDRIHNAITHWEEKTSIRFVERTSANRSQYPNYVVFRPSSGCSSYVGMIGGPQPINLAPGCGLKATIHEIGHAVGLWHEQSRADRDDYVTVHYENIIPGLEFNFNKHTADARMYGPYDYDSIMHYPRWAFSKNGKDTIVPHDNQEIGHRDELSEGDIAAVEALYNQGR